jgi:MFS family permease
VLSESDVRYEGWRVAGASAVSGFFVSVLVFTFPVFLKPLAEEFSWSRQSVSVAFGITAATSAVCALLFGWLADRLGPRRIIVPCMALFGAALVALSALTPRLWHLYLNFGVLGMLGTGASPIVYARAVSSWFESRRGLALAIALSGRAVGGVVHPATAAALIPIVGWRGACVTLGALALTVGLPIVGAFIRERPSADARRAGAGPTAGASVGDAVRSRAFGILIAMLLGTAFSQSGAVVHLSALLTDRGVSPGSAALAVSASGAATVVGRFVTGWLLDRFFAARVAVTLIATAAVGTFLLARADSFASGTFAAVLIGLGVGGESDVAPYLLSRYFGLRSFSTLYALTWIATAGAAAAGPIMMGRAFDATGSYEALLIRFALLELGVAVLMLALPPYESAQKLSVSRT